MKSYVILPLLFLLSFFSCTKEKKASQNVEGHIVFIHQGDQNVPVTPFIFKTSSDTTYLKYKRNPDYLFADFRGSGYLESCIEEVEASQYKALKSILIEYSHLEIDRTHFGDQGSFVILISDTERSLDLQMSRSKLSAQYMTKIIDFARENKLQKTFNQFKMYLQLQSESSFNNEK